MRRELERIEIQGEHDARVRAWELVRAAFAEREPAPRGAPVLRPLLAFAAIAAVVAAALSPPGRAVLRTVRDAVLPERVERAQPALFSLPAPGRLLVVTDDYGDTFVVQPDGSRRRLGDYEEAKWSPHGRFVVATRRNGLFALTPKGEQRWSLPRPNVGWARWGGTRIDTRVAYVSRRDLRVVAGDGGGDRLLDRSIGGTPPAWKPGGGHILAYVDRAARITVVDADSRRVSWRSPATGVAQLAWSADGRRLLAVSLHAIRVFDDRGRLLQEMPMRPGKVALGAALAPTGHVFALHVRADRATPGRSQILLVNADRSMRPRQLFAGAGVFGDLAWSPDGRWLLVDWLGADQWLFVRTRGKPKIVAVSNIGVQFESPAGVHHFLDWCCP